MRGPQERTIRVSVWGMLGALAIAVQSVVHMLRGPLVVESVCAVVAAAAFVAVTYEALTIRRLLRGKR